MSDRGRRGGRPGGPMVQRGRRAGRAVLGYGPVPIDERVRQAHLDHFCPGAVGLPVAGSGPIGLGLPAAAEAGSADHPAGAAGRRCSRCGEPIAPGQDARRQASGPWVHEACPR